MKIRNKSEAKTRPVVGVAISEIQDFVEVNSKLVEGGKGSDLDDALRLCRKLFRRHQDEETRARAQQQLLLIMLLLLLQLLFLFMRLEPRSEWKNKRQRLSTSSHSRHVHVSAR